MKMKTHKPKVAKSKLNIPKMVSTADMASYISEFDKINLLRPVTYRVGDKLINEGDAQ